jgi:hypothetical protein
LGSPFKQDSMASMVGRFPSSLEVPSRKLEQGKGGMLLKGQICRHPNEIASWQALADVMNFNTYADLRQNVFSGPVRSGRP